MELRRSSISAPLRWTSRVQMAHARSCKQRVEMGAAAECTWQKNKNKHPLRFSFSLFLRVSSWWETKRDKSYKTYMYWRHILPWWMKPSAVDATAHQQQHKHPACSWWIGFPMVLKLPTSLSWIRAAGGDGLQTCLVLYSPYLPVFALQLPPQYSQLLLSNTGQRKGLVVCFNPQPDYQPPSPHYKQTTTQGFRCWRGTQDTPELNGNMCEVGGKDWCRGWLQHDQKGYAQIQGSVSGVGIRLR